jgi:hypothetical protein
VAGHARAFGCTELEDDEIAQSIIMRSITRDNGAFFGVDELAAAWAIVLAILSLAPTGELDGLAGVDADLYVIEATSAHDEVYNRAPSAGWPALTSVDTKMRLRGETDKVLDLVIAAGREGA